MVMAIMNHSQMVNLINCKAKVYLRVDINSSSLLIFIYVTWPILFQNYMFAMYAFCQNNTSSSPLLAAKS